MNKEQLDANLIYLIDTRTRFCEVGAWSPTQTDSGDLILRRAISLGSLWDLAEKGEIRLNGLVAVTEETYMSPSLEEYTSGGGNSWRQKRVAAVIDTGGETRFGTFGIHIFPEGSWLIFPKKQPIQGNPAVALAAYEALACRQMFAGREWYIEDGQEDAFQYAELKWDFPDSDALEFPEEHEIEVPSDAEPFVYAGAC